MRQNNITRFFISFLLSIIFLFSCPMHLMGYEKEILIIYAKKSKNRRARSTASHYESFEKHVFSVIPTKVGIHNDLKMLVLDLTLLPLRASSPAEPPCHCKSPVDRQSEAAKGMSGQVKDWIPVCTCLCRHGRQAGMTV